MAAIVRRDPVAAGSSIVHGGNPRTAMGIGAACGQGVVITNPRSTPMTDLIPTLIAALPLVALVALIAEAIRTGSGGPTDLPPVDLLYRAYNA